jgi:CheY-like chemotaxis protein
MARILVIDDEPLVRVSIEAVLGAKGHQVSLAANGREGLDKLKDGEFDLIITDLIMPEMEGIETILAIRKQCAGLRVIAISGGGRHTSADFLDMAAKLGANAILRKPFTNDELLAAIGSVLT